MSHMRYENAEDDFDQTYIRFRKMWPKVQSALERLISFAETSDTRQARTVASLLLSIPGRGTFNLSELRTLNGPVRRDVLLCIEAACYGHIVDMLPGGLLRCIEANEAHGLLRSDHAELLRQVLGEAAVPPRATSSDEPM
ncbi:MAG: DUF7673 family protein [Hydrogenophaga sp.]|uniref:DUF7673 family protein n=3 Tax=Hydrogenophaga sp. TaxID=1904254 RepID=UPI00403500F2